MEHQEMTGERLNKAEQQLAEANRRADEANEQLSASIARAEKAEQQSVEKIFEAEGRIQKAAEAAAQLEQKFLDAMKRIEGSTGMRQRLNVMLADAHTQIELRWMMQMHDEKLMNNF
jgi:chromosome segregation ATPase